MSMTDLLKAEEIKKALDAFAAETFDPKKFFEMVGMKAMSAENVKKVFQVLDVDGSGFIEEEELKFVLKGFSKEGRDLTDDETKAFLKAADKDGDGKIGIDGCAFCLIGFTSRCSHISALSSHFSFLIHLPSPHLTSSPLSLLLLTPCLRSDDVVNKMIYEESCEDRKDM
ncbi:hypothetical protein L3Q82_019976, partial [Scortum barcoo]